VEPIGTLSGLHSATGITWSSPKSQHSPSWKTWQWIGHLLIGRAWVSELDPQFSRESEGAAHYLAPGKRGWPLVCGFLERISSSLCAIRTTLRQLGLSQSLSSEVFAWLPSSSRDLVARSAI